jgi:hypothetical protein
MTANTTYSQRTGSFQPILSNCPRGRYLLSFTLDPGTLHLVELLLTDNSQALVAGCAQCYTNNPTFDQNVANIICNPGNDYYDLNLQYLNQVLSITLMDDSSGSPANATAFDLLYLGTDLPIVSSNTAVDVLTSSSGNTPITISNDLQTTGRLRTTTTITGSASLDNTYDIVLCNPTNAIIITLPQGSLNNGREYSIVNKSTNTILINTYAGDTIDDGSTSSLSLSTQYSKLKLTCDGTTNWFSNL